MSLFPLLLRRLPADCSELGALLDQLTDPDLLWAPFGLRLPHPVVLDRIAMRARDSSVSQRTMTPGAAIGFGSKTDANSIVGGCISGTSYSYVH